MFKKFYFKNKKLFKVGGIVFITLLFLLLYFFSFSNKIIVQNSESDVLSAETSIQKNNTNNQKNKLPLNNITGINCQNGEKRPYAVMLAADKVARPLSGVSEADLIIEMPVITDGITRYMALFKCEKPKEIGSIRSARHDFITLADSFDTIYAHWGGSYLALEKLNNNIMDNIDALKNPNKTFYRKSNLKAPHNGFTSYKKLEETAIKLKYRQTTDFLGYPHTIDKSETDQRYQINIAYPKPYNVSFDYNPEINSYFRFVNGFKEVDRNNNKQVVVKNIVIMKAKSRQVDGQYNDVDIESFGDVVVYRNGEIISGKWQKKDKKYYFLDKNNKEIKFTPGKIWISIVQPNERVFIKNL